MTKIILSVLFSLGLYASSTHTAKVIETLNSGGYSYIQVKEADENYWIAMTQRSLKVGESISFNEQGWMHKFHSKTLDRTFDKILFASDTTEKAEAVEMKANIMNSPFKVKGTISVAELFKNRDKYVGKKVQVRAKVTKTSEGIMKRNWVHVQDGSRFQNADDLVFTSSRVTPKIGSMIIAEGVVVKDKDFGYGYFYPVIVEEATFSKSLQ